MTAVKVTLASHVITEVVGGQLFLLDSQDKQVYWIPLSDVMEWDPATRTLLGKPSVTSALQVLCDKGVAGLGTGAISRRGVVTAGGVLVGGGVLAFALPEGALASSPGNSSDDGGHDPSTTADLYGAWQPTAGQPNNPQYRPDPADPSGDLAFVFFSFGLREEDVEEFFDLGDAVTFTVLGLSETIGAGGILSEYGSIFIDISFGFDVDVDDPRRVTPELAALVVSNDDIEATLSDGTTTIDVVFTRQDFAEFFGWGSA